MSIEQFNLAGKTALVTGASRGLGQAMAIGLAAAGADVIVTSRKLESCNDTVKAIEKQGQRALAISCDMRVWRDVERLVEQAQNQWGRLNVLVNNAGTAEVRALHEVDEESFDHLFYVNVRAPLHLASRVVEASEPEDKLSIINVASTGALHPEPNTGCYCPSKAALINLSGVMAREWAEKNVRVNNILPHAFMTEMLKDALDKMPELENALTGRMALNRLGDLQEIVGAAVFLASDASSYMTGENMTVSGGYF